MTLIVTVVAIVIFFTPQALSDHSVRDKLEGATPAKTPLTSRVNDHLAHTGIRWSDLRSGRDVTEIYTEQD